MLIIRRLELNDIFNKYMAFTRDENGGRSYSIRIDNGSFDMAEHFKELGINLTNQNSLQEEIICGYIIKNTTMYV